MNRPYISFVLVCRNDNYAGNFLYRLQAFINVLLALGEKYKLEMELIIVEWNPPKENLKLREALKWPKMSENSKVRLIEVPNEIHQRLPNSDRMPIFEWIGKNVGIKRAKGEYILATNADILFNEELIKFLSEAVLLPKYFYRVDRYDIKSPIPLNKPIEKIFKYCRENILVHLSQFGEVRRGFNLKNISEGTKGFLSYFKKRILYFPFVPVHTVAAGDFFLTHRDNWNSLRGFPEFKLQLPVWAHVDSYFCYAALASGLREFILKKPLRIYHQDHDHKESLQNRPPLDHKLYKKHCWEMLRGKRSTIFNDGKWGLGDVALSEKVIG